MNWDTSLAGNSKVTVILAIIGLGLVIIAAKLFGYVLAIAEFAYGIIVFLIYLKLRRIRPEQDRITAQKSRKNNILPLSFYGGEFFYGILQPEYQAVFCSSLIRP